MNAKGQLMRWIWTAMLVLLAGGAVASNDQAVYVVVLQAQRPGEAAFDVTQFGGTLRHRSGPRLAVTLPDAAVEGIRRHPQVRYVQKMVLGRPAARITASAAEATMAAATTAAPPPPSPFRVSANATMTWQSGTYKYDGSGNIAAIGPSSSVVTNSYTYDRIGRLSAATIHDGTAAHTESYVHDATGNLTQLTKGTVTLSFPVEPGTNRLASSVATYDEVGNITARSGEAFQYDAVGMVSHKDPYVYIYTAYDERLATVHENPDPAYDEGRGWLWTVRDLQGKVIREYESFGNGVDDYFLWVEDHYFAGGTLVASQREVAEGGRRHFHLDHLGTPRLVTDAAGNRVSEHVYAPYGREITSLLQERARGFNREQPLRFTGHERDGLNDQYSEDTTYLDYMHARYYDPNWGRFLSVDPVLNIKRSIREPQSWNRYSYVVNNPINRIDPDGRVDINIPYPAGAENWTKRSVTPGTRSGRLNKLPRGLATRL